MSRVFITNVTTSNFTWRSDTDTIPFESSPSTTTGYLHWISIGSR
jgi:hypothetical protein